jgi:hypothetical protein
MLTIPRLPNVPPAAGAVPEEQYSKGRPTMDSQLTITTGAAE